MGINEPLAGKDSEKNRPDGTVETTYNKGQDKGQTSKLEIETAQLQDSFNAALLELRERYSDKADIGVMDIDGTKIEFFVLIK